MDKKLCTICGLLLNATDVRAEMHPRCFSELKVARQQVKYHGVSRSHRARFWKNKLAFLEAQRAEVLLS